MRVAHRGGASLRSAAAGRVIRVLLSPAHAGRSWTQRDLQALTCVQSEGDAPVSLGLVNKLIRSLLAEGFVEHAGERIRVSIRVRDPAGLLSAWRVAYRFDRHERHDCFTLLKGAALVRAIEKAGLGSRGQLAHAAFSAAERQAPHVRQGKTWLYAGAALLDHLLHHVEGKEVESGENLIVLVPEDAGVFLSFEAAPSGEARALGCTDPVQT